MSQQRMTAIVATFLVFAIKPSSQFHSVSVPRERHSRITASEWSLGYGRYDSNLDIQFGSDDVSGSSWGDDGDEDRMAVEFKQRQKRVEELLEDEDRDFRSKRKAKKWGKFANVTRTEDLEPLLEEEKQAIDRDNQEKASLAASKGVTFEVLAPRDTEEIADENMRISIGNGQEPKSWFSDMDDDLKFEWEALTGSDDPKDSTTTEEDEDEKPSNGLSAADEVAVDDSTGNLVAKDALQGVRVGSAGGWSLEVFPGDFVVHRKFGIGKFERTCLRPKTKLSAEERDAQSQRRGEMLREELRKLNKAVTQEEIQEVRAKFGTEEDKDPISNPQVTVLEISYADAVVHVPVDRAYRLSRYRAGDAVVKPRLSRVRGEAWRKAKENVEEKTLALAQEVLALYATRETLERPPFEPKLEGEVNLFENTFPFDPTPDQQKCFEDVENDMVWRNRPMDRLVCGDVGFGKTEVALRALYRAVANGRQAALLAPTGVLAAQHFKNVLKRMGPETPFNVTCSLLRGGMSAKTKAGREMRKHISSGEIQLVVGTHALLSNDLGFKDLSLLVVDEEQRFGVKQKERLKMFANGVDVLTLSATPIPRTLQMSLSGIRDTSTIRSPPPMRKPTITYVQDFDESIVKEAISTELGRGGQCYYVVPRISMLEDAEKLLNKLFPDIRIIQAHGRMKRNGAEDNVAEFAEGRHDVLLATTVIENGVDIPSVNTIIVQNSQAFGISTLYQLRGRVGRSDQQAYAYFLHREESITEQASMRLQALGELTELGSGFDIANRDLEIRGAGSLLGTEQSGMAAKVGFDLYMRMLKKSIRLMRGLDLPQVPRTNVLLETDGTPDSFSLPESFLPDELARRKEETKARLAESTASLVNLTNTWKDSYGALPAIVQRKLKTMHLHACTRRLGIDLVGSVKVNDEGQYDCFLRSPGLRPRHIATISHKLPRLALPKGIDVIFPSRFTASGGVEVLLGGKKIDAEALAPEDSGEEESDWDEMDKEEEEAMKDISSASNVKDMDHIDLEQYPRFRIRNCGAPGDKKSIDLLLKLVLPLSKAVYEKQENEAEQAKAAADLRNRQELMKKRRAANEALESQRLGYRY
mmetsp:Transcript_5616/g.11583  ORF Transcript_5616/g.11583 Transcript_5616/m.11583 type:complete len:1097 (-) Transcript_5616:41-3331(-)